MKKFIAAAVVAAVASASSSSSSVSAAGTWTDMCTGKPSGTCPGIMMGVGCASESLCAIVGGYSNTPESVYYSKDQFATYTLATMDTDSYMLLDMAVDANGAGATAGLGVLNNTGVLYTKDVTEWMATNDKNFLQGQDINAFGNGEFGFVGATNAFANEEGVLVSKDEGKDWVAKNWPANVSNMTEARYGSFPSDQVLYVTGGNWPSNKNATLFQHPENCLRLSHKTCVPVGDKFAEQARAFNARRERFGATDGTNGYFGLISKSEDGGNTWVVQLQAANQGFYFNDINCVDTTHCFAVAEGFSDGTAPGARIFGTTDGKTWNRVFMDTTPNASLMRVHMVSRTEAWAAGGHVENGTAYGTFYHTIDGGKTWTLEGKVIYVGDIMGFHFVNSKLGFAVGITEFQTSTMLKYTN